MRNISQAYRASQIKNIMVVTAVAIPLIFVFIFTYVVPFGQEYKEKRKEYQLAKNANLDIENTYSEKLNRLNLLKEESKPIIEIFNEPKNIELFVEESKFIKSMRLVDSNSSDEIFIKELYKVETHYLPITVQEFYKFIENGSRNGLIFEVKFPISFSTIKNKIQGKFYLNLYRLKDVNRDLVKPFKQLQRY